MPIINMVGIGGGSGNNEILKVSTGLNSPSNAMEGDIWVKTDKVINNIFYDDQFLITKPYKPNSLVIKYSSNSTDQGMKYRINIMNRSKNIDMSMPLFLAYYMNDKGVWEYPYIQIFIENKWCYLNGTDLDQSQTFELHRSQYISSARATPSIIQEDRSGNALSEQMISNLYQVYSYIVHPINNYRFRIIQTNGLYYAPYNSVDFKIINVSKTTSPSACSKLMPSGNDLFYFLTNQQSGTPYSTYLIKMHPQEPFTEYWCKNLCNDATESYYTVDAFSEGGITQTINKIIDRNGGIIDKNTGDYVPSTFPKAAQAIFADSNNNVIAISGKSSEKMITITKMNEQGAVLEEYTINSSIIYSYNTMGCIDKDDNIWLVSTSAFTNSLCSVSKITLNTEHKYTEQFAVNLEYKLFQQRLNGINRCLCDKEGNLYIYNIYTPTSLTRIKLNPNGILQYTIQDCNWGSTATSYIDFHIEPWINPFPISYDVNRTYYK